jgi:serine/threonine protein phosphatase PrpC
MTMSNIHKPEGGFYQVGDELATKEQAIAFLKAVGWLSYKYFTNSKLLVDCENDSAKCSVTPFCDGLLPYTIKGFLPEHTATATTPNPPLTFEEAMELDTVFADHRSLPIQDNCVFILRKDGLTNWPADDLVWIDLVVRRGKVYALDPATHPPTPREDG